MGQGFKKVKLMEVINVMAGSEQEYTEVYHRINKFLCAYSTLQFICLNTTKNGSNTGVTFTATNVIFNFLTNSGNGKRSFGTIYEASSEVREILKDTTKKVMEALDKFEN